MKTWITVPLFKWEGGEGCKKISEKCGPPWLSKRKNFAHHSSLKGLKQLLTG